MSSWPATPHNYQRLGQENQSSSSPVHQQGEDKVAECSLCRARKLVEPEHGVGAKTQAQPLSFAPRIMKSTSWEPDQAPVMCALHLGHQAALREMNAQPCHVTLTLASSR